MLPPASASHEVAAPPAAALLRGGARGALALGAGAPAGPSASAADGLTASAAAGTAAVVASVAVGAAALKTTRRVRAGRAPQVVRRATAVAQAADGDASAGDASVGDASASGAAGTSRAVRAPSHDSDAPYDARLSPVGITGPLGFWDPVGFMKEPEGEGFRWKSEATFHRYQEAEIKHGRVAMLAATGMLFASVAQFPGFNGVPAGWAALNAPGAAGSLGVLVIVSGWLELRRGALKEPGNLGDPGQVLEDPSNDWASYSIDMRNMEINHGRMAMSAVATEFLAEYGSDLGPAEQLAGAISSGGQFATLIGLLLALQQTPEYTEKEEADILAKIQAGSK